MKKYDGANRDPLTGKVIAICYKVHADLGPGFAERIYLKAVKKLLKDAGVLYEAERDFEVVFEGEKMGKFRADLVIQKELIVELKAVFGRMPKVFESQVISYLKASGLKVGLLVNFGNRSCEVRRLMVEP